MAKPLPRGNYPALETFRELIAPDVVISRKAGGLSQVEPANWAGIRRPETLNRIEKVEMMLDEATVAKIEKVPAKK
jgi:hypothetical protein